MTLERIDSHAPGSDGWLTQRATRIGGSEVAVVLGLSPWESPFSLWHRKQHKLPPIPDSEPMEWGRRLEDVILDKWAEDHQPTDLLTGSTWERDGWRLANPDAIATVGSERVVVEIKNAARADAWESGPPVHYLCQVQWYMDVLDIDRAFVVVLIGGNDYREYEVERSHDDAALMVTKCREFIDSIAAGVRPDIDDAYATFQAIRELHPDIDRGADHELPAGIANRLLASRRAHDAAKKEWTLMQSIVLDQMGSAQHALHPDGFRVAYRMARKTAAGDPGTPFLAIDRKAL